MSDLKILPIRRLIAYAWDYLLIASYASALLLVGLLSRATFGDPHLGPWQGDAVAFGLLVLPVILYFAVQESGASGATFGKRRMGLRVVGVDGSRVSLSQSLIRSSVKFAPWQLAHTCIFHLHASENPPAWATAGLYVAFALVAVYLGGLFLTSRHRPLYDVVAGTMVVTEGEPFRAP